jgi:glutamine cyclotransferase
MSYTQGLVVESGSVWNTGKISGWINLTGLKRAPGGLVYPYVLNGIAYNNDTGRLLVTGKCWPNVCEIELV